MVGTGQAWVGGALAPAVGNVDYSIKGMCGGRHRACGDTERVVVKTHHRGVSTVQESGPTQNIVENSEGLSWTSPTVPHLSHDSSFRSPFFSDPQFPVFPIILYSLQQFTCSPIPVPPIIPSSSCNATISPMILCYPQFFLCHRAWSFP